jgi:hypothetical protein
VPSQSQNVAVSKKVVLPLSVPALTTEGETPALVFLNQLGEAYVFPFEGPISAAGLVNMLVENFEFSDEEKKQILTALTKGITPATALDLPPGVKL